MLVVQAQSKINKIIEKNALFLQNVLLVNAGGCKASLATVSVVNRCPKTEEEWTTAAARKNCGNIKHNCVFIQYHCVMNTWRNKTIEVCAQSKNIVGKKKVKWC